ncbi:MAG: aminotransferase class IV [Parvularculaceae bacterium]|nr:aminotransferase class IV [Parvularculaceae bacterium]
MTIIPVAEVMQTHPEHARLPHAPEYERGAAYIIDHYCPMDQAQVPITDLGFNRADAVYDVVTVVRGQFFRMEEHQERFARSLERIRLRNPLTTEQEREVLNRIVALSGLKDAYVWWGVTRGSMPARSSDRLNPDSFNNRFYAFVTPYIFINNDEQRGRGINLWVSQNHIRIPPKAVDPRAKNFHGLDLAMSLYEAGDNNAEWSVLTDGEGVLTESPGSNIFVIKDGVVATPDLGCLEGVTRQSALDLAEEAGFKTEVRVVTEVELRNADEAFITSSAGGIMPISRVDNQLLGHGEGPGEICTTLHNAYWEKRWNGWDAIPVDYSVTDEGTTPLARHG